MILRLRRWHRNSIVMGALIAPLILFGALQARAPNAVDNVLHQYRNILPSDAVLMGEHAIRVGPAAMDLAVYQTRSSAAPWHLSLSASGNRRSAGPDVLLYWQSGERSDALFVDAMLLGPLLTQRDSVLPLTITDLTGRLVFYSLAHQRVLETLDLTTFNRD